MDSWPLQGDSYSFLRSAPHTFSLCHRDGTPNHIEIFDIINVPSQRSAISETTCLCDIFGDDCESPSLSSNPAIGPFIPSQREVDGTAASSSLVDDLNDSSGSYHSAQGFSEGEEGFEESRERFYSPQLQSESSERRQPGGERQSSEHPEVTEDNNTNLEPIGKSPVPQHSTASPSSDVLDITDSTPSAGHNSPDTLNPEGRVSLVEKERSPSPPNPREEAEPRRITPTFKDRHSPSHHSSTPSPSPDPRNCVSSSTSQSVIQSLTEFGIPQVSPEPRSSCFNQHNSPLPEHTTTDFSLEFTESAFESRDILSSPSPSTNSTELSYPSRETLVSPDLKNRPYSPDTQASSPFPDLRRRVSLPDIFSRGFTPDIEDSTHNPGLISDLSVTPTPPESQGTRLSVEAASTVSSTESTPAPRYTPPSPVISIATSPQLLEHIVSPEPSYRAPSPGLLSAASPAKTGTTTPSPGTSQKRRHISTPSEIESQVSSPVLSHSLSPSPEVRSNCSPVEHRYTSPSPEIRITASSPEVSRREGSSEVQNTSTSPLLEPHFDSGLQRSLTSSPHITGISYSIVQPEDRDSSPFPELSHLSTPEPERTLIFSETENPTSSRDSPTGSPQVSPHIFGFINSIVQPEITHQPRYPTPSPHQSYYTPSPEPRYQSPSADQNPSPQYRSKTPSPVASSPEQSYSKHPPANLSTEYNPECSPLGSTLEFEEASSSVNIIETQYPTHLAKESVSPSFELDRDNTSAVSEIKSRPPVVADSSPVSISPLAEEKVHSSLKKERTKTEAMPQKVSLQENASVDSFSEEKQVIGPTPFQKEDIYNNLPIEIQSAFPYIVSEDMSPSLSLQRAPSKSSVHRLESPQHQVTSYAPLSENSSSLKSACKNEHTRRQLSTSDRHENSERLTEDMAHHVNRRRTPSPPLTRFTPVHIIAPEKPYRHWQKSSRNPSQVVATSASGKLKKALTNRESPSVTPVDNNSQAHGIRLGMQLEMERKMQLEEDREVGGERLMDREMEREGEEHLEKGKEWQDDTRYRGEQVELSFNARNRKGPASRRAARTSRETCQGLPTVHSYSESLLDTRLLQQQQSLLGLASQQDTGGGGSSRRLQPPAYQNKISAAGRVAINRPCQSSSSSMGSELDEADNEVKWFTDLAFRSLSSPEVDYLDMYNSSHRSSTNISQPSTQESPAGVSAAWMAYADFRASAPKLDNEELSFQQPSVYYSDGLEPSRCFELGSFECIDVAMEKEDSQKVRRGVPKRQIQLKRKDNSKGKQDESSQNSSPSVLMMTGNPSVESPSGGTLARQHSTPAAIPACFPTEHSPEPNEQIERKSKLKKSVSLDEACTKTKMATCFIKSVLSKKMQNVDKQPDEQAGDISPAFEENSAQTENAVAPLSESSKLEAHNLSSSLQSDYSLSSEGPGEPNSNDEAKPLKSYGGRSRNKPSSSSSSRSINFSKTESEEADSQSRQKTSLRSEIRSEMKVPFDIKQSRTGVQQADDIKTWSRKEGGDLANATAGNTGAPFATGASSSQTKATNRNQECENTEDHKQLQQGDKGPHTSERGEISVQDIGKKKASLNVCLTPEAENKPGLSSPDMSYREKEERVETIVNEKTVEEEGNGNNQVKAPLHKVRDVRRLVKNTYNLSFKTGNAVMTSNVNEEMVGNFNKGKREGIKGERRGEVIAGEEREVKQEKRREEKREETEEGFRVNMKEDQKEEVKESKLPTLPPPLQPKGNLPSCPLPMQIEYKAVCWKEDKNKLPCERDSHANTLNCTTVDTAIARSYQHDLKMTAGTQESTTEVYKVSDNGDKPPGFRTDRKPPMLGSLPKQPSKEREVSTAIVLIRDGGSKAKTSTSAAQEKPPILVQVPAASHSPGPTTASSSGHSVSMFLKEKGYQADIGAVVGDNQNAADGKRISCKHVNCLEIPLQTTTPSDVGHIQCHRERTFSSSSNISDNTDSLKKTSEDEEVANKPTVRDSAKQKSTPLLRNTLEQTAPPTKHTKQKQLGDFEAVRRLDPTFPPRSPAIRRFRPQPIEVKSVTKEIQKQEKPTNSTANNKPQSIEVKSIAKNSQKPAVPPKPNCKFKPADLGPMPNETQRSSASTSSVKPQGEDRPQTIVVSSPTIYRKISNDSTSVSNYTRKLSVSAVSSLKPSPCKATETTFTTLSNQSAAPSKMDAYHDRGQQQKPGASSQNSSNTQRPTTLANTPTAAPGTCLSSAPGPVSDTEANQVPDPASAGTIQPSLPTVDLDSQPKYPRLAYPHEHIMPVSSNNAKQPAASTTQMPGYSHQPCHRSLSEEHHHRTDDLHFYASDDPPSYDERESFSPLMLPDLTPRRSNRYQPSSRPPPCSCTAGCPSHPGLIRPQRHLSPHTLTPPAPPHSPGQGLPYPLAQPPLCPHQCRSDPQQISYQPGSPKTSPIGPSQPPAIYQPLHQPPPHPSLIQACPADRPLQPPQHIDSRRPPVHRSPQQQPLGISGAPYCNPGHSHSPGLPPMDPQYLCGPQSLGPSFGSEYGGDTSSLYSESSYGQTPRRVLLDPETGKYFYVEVPVQPLRKMLFDPETGQYVEVLIPQQAMSHSGLYPPSAAPYPPLHNPNMYAPAPQYMPYAAPPPPAHAQAQPQPPRYPEASAAAATMHQSGPGVSYRNPSGQASKPEPQNHPPLDQSYLESMYYVPTGMTASPNPTPPDYYPKQPPNLPPTGGERS